jgi:ABC-2 type transport system permease protein
VTALRWTLTDALTITTRALQYWARQPGLVLVGLLFPVLMVVMLGYLWGGQMQLPGGASYFDFLLPGMFVLTMAFGVEATMLAVATDAARGVTDRFRSMPMASSAVVAGRAVADVLFSMAGLAVVMAAGVLVGWRWDAGAGGVLAAIGLLALLRFALVWVGVYLGLVASGPEAVQAVQVLVWPLAFLSSAFVSPDSMPGALGTLAEWNPLSSTVAATRELFGNPGWGGDSWIAQHAELMAVVWPLAIIAVFLPLSVARWRRLSR